MRGWLTIAAIGMLSGVLAVARADKALLIGVNEYPRLAKGSNLEGCVNDAQNMAAALSKRGFAVTTLVNEQASKRAILDALARLKTETRVEERFVFYFAGHGVAAPDGASALMPGDATDGSAASDLHRDELYNAVMAIPAQSRTVLLDSCFSGGVSRRALGRQIKQTRFYRRIGGTISEESRRRDIEQASGDSNDHISSGAEIVYFTASLANQTSGEDDFDGKRGGVFTHFLLARLEKATPTTLWNEVQKDVTGEVADYMEQTQTPKLSPSEYAARLLFAGKEKPSPPPMPIPDEKRTAWDDFNEDHTDASCLTLIMQPQTNTVKVRQTFTFTAKVGAQHGWLVLLEKDTDGKVYVLFPGNRSLEAAQVAANSVVRLPMASERSYAADTPGVERVKALLFTDQANADALLKAFPQDGAEPRKLKRILETAAPRQTFYTFGLTFGVE